MGSIQSHISSEAALTVLAVAGAVGFGYYTRLNSGAAETIHLEDKALTVKKGKKKGQAQKSVKDSTSDAGATSTSQTPVPNLRVVAFPEVIPGQFELFVEPMTASQDVTLSKAKKSKKKKGKQAVVDSTAPAAPSSSVDEQSEPSFTPSKPNPNRKQQTAQTPTPSSSYLARSIQQSSTSIDTDGSWTRVETRRKAGSVGEDHLHSAEATTSDAGITTSVTGNSSPVAERTEDESFLLNPRDSSEGRQTLAQKLLPKARKTGVEDLLESSDYPTLSRVMRIKPRPDERPASGFSWGDYEDVRVTDGGENDADGEDDGWGVVKSRRSKVERLNPSSVSQVQKAPETITKRQRQNAQKRDSQKAAKATAEAERLATLKGHKQELERLKAMEQQSKRGSGKSVSGGMQAKVDEHGKLVWE